MRSGADRDALLTALEAGEPDRRRVLSATLALMVAVGLMIGIPQPLAGVSLVQIAIGLIAAAGIWRLSNFMWRPKAIAVAAPLVGARWGQSQLDTGLAAIDWAEWWEAWGLRGYRLVGWRSSGDYRAIRYSLQEVTIYRRRHKHGPSDVTHLLLASIALPAAFAGTVNLLPAGGLIAELDDVLRKVTGEELQRIPVDADFDRQFDTLATSNAAIDQLLTPAFRTVMMSLAQRNRGLSGRFKNGWFELQLTVPDVTFRSAKLHRPLPELLEQADQLWWELTVPHRLIDAVLGNHDGPLR